MKDELGNVICPKCKERKYRITSVSVDENKPGLIKFRATCPCKKKFSYSRPVQDIGIYYPPEEAEQKLLEPIVVAKPTNVKKSIKRKVGNKRKRR